MIEVLKKQIEVCAKAVQLQLRTNSEELLKHPMEKTHFSMLESRNRQSMLYQGLQQVF